MVLTTRKKQILSVVVEEYIHSAEPVGSKLVMEKSSLAVSSATIRNEMSELEAMGYLEKPHTSAGRIPSPKGYRLYVNELMERQKLNQQETEQINHQLNLRLNQLDRLIAEVGRLCADLTQYPVLALTSSKALSIMRFDLIYIDARDIIIVAMLSNEEVKNKLIKLPFSVDESNISRLSGVLNARLTNLTAEQISYNLIDSISLSVGDTMGLVSIIASFAIEVLTDSTKQETFLSGQSNLLRLPEYKNSDKAGEILAYLSEGGLSSLPIADSGEVKMLIGPENVAEELKDSSVIMASYDIGDGTKCIIGVVGPTRMDYRGVTAKLSFIAENLSRNLNQEAPPSGWGKLSIKGEVNDEGENDSG
ncbi:heat-inducible transcriptional repressor HrcA [Clostridiaceae bacterium OttesenSCG-928-D20]|nr:heat-inducible transcriptional repressor HrcA [Clostridiaceae bacterium OttesenSCG-928-D20]